MKCSKCGYDNPDYAEYCSNCGEPVEAKSRAGSAEPSWGFVKAPRWPEPDFSAETVSEADIPDDAFFASERVKEDDNAHDGDHADVLFTEDDADEDIEFPASLDADDAEGKLYEDDEYDEDIGGDYEDDDEYEPDDEPRRIKKSGRSKPGGANSPKNLKNLIILFAFIAVAAIIAIVLAIVLSSGDGNGGTPDGSESPVASQEPDTGENEQGKIEPNPSDASYLFVTVYAPEGSVLVYVTNDGTRSEVTVDAKGYVKFNVPKSTLIPLTPIETSPCVVAPTVFIKNADGTETQLDMPTVSVEAPALDITFNNEASITSEDGSVGFSGSVMQVNTAVTIVGVLTETGDEVFNETLTVNEDGTFAYDAAFEAEGTYQVTITAQLGGYVISKSEHTVVVTVPAPPVVSDIIQMPWEYGDETFSQRVVFSAVYIDVWGKVPVGYTLTATNTNNTPNMSFESQPTVTEDGIFRFKVAFHNEIAGDYTITLTATAPDGTVTTRDIHVQRAPEYTPYKNRAIEGSYSLLTTDHSQPYRLSGTVKEIVSDGECIVVKFELDDGNEILLTYYDHYGSAGELVVGQHYSQIYGRTYGLNADGIPNVFVWFVDD